MKRVLISGAAGFIGHHVVEAMLKWSDQTELVFLDRLDCSGNLNRITDIACWPQNKTRCKWVCHDLRAPLNEMLIKQIGPIDTILHLAASTHVDRSIADPLSFVMDNVVGTANILDYARIVQPGTFLYFSTDEVFGPAPAGVAYKEWDRYKSANPYAATKAGAEELCIAYHNTYRLPVIITHAMNVMGERQHPEKYIPSTIRKVRDGETVIVHADKTKTRAGTRFYIHARNVADGLAHVLGHDKWRDGDKYNIVGEREVDNLELAELIAEFVGLPLKYEMVDFHSSRPGHDLRYALDGSKMTAMGWKPPIHFEESLRRMVQWTLEHPEWLRA